ncbi:BRO family protein [Helicobacter sp.]|uniref:BRO family protein n=1 Tax=Helicobacter sp. TaxID=218 RepID=UPI002A74A038|nr:BRO family protein [Helicobacter sp.]MDY2585318.1 BRO family protein [Helicobacter sp.]
MQLQVFEKSDLGQIRVIGDNENPLFCLSDVCRALDLQNPAHATNAIKSEFELPTLNVVSFDTGYGIKEFTMITEPQLYFVLMRSDKPKAKLFRKWITSEVLPSIRKTGSYTIKNNAPALPQTYKEALQHLIVQVEKNEKLQEENLRLLESKANLNRLMHSERTYLSTTLAKELGLRSAKELHEILNRVGVIYKRDRAWLPYAKYEKYKLIESKSELIKKADGEVIETYTSRWTQAGREFLLREWNKIVEYYARRLKNESARQMDKCN